MNRHTQNTLRYFESLGSSIFGIINRPDPGNPRFRKYWRSKLREIDREITEAKKRWVEFVGVEIPTAFRIESRKVQAIFIRQKFKRRSGRRWQPQTIQAIEDWTILRLFDGLDAGRRDIARLFHLRQLAAIDQTKINESLQIRLREIKGSGAGPLSDREAAEALRRGLIGEKGGTPRTIQNEVLKTLEQRIGRDGKIMVERVNGKIVRYRPEAFAKKIARRGVSVAQNQAALNTILEFGQDLVRITDHNTETPICLPHEGRAYSISGTNPDYPALRVMPPYHDFCLHGIAPFIEAPDGSRRSRDQQESLRKVIKRNNAKLIAIQKKKEQAA